MGIRTDRKQVQDSPGPTPTTETTTLLRLLLPLQPWLWRNKVGAAPRPPPLAGASFATQTTTPCQYQLRYPFHHPLLVPASLPTCSLSMASSGPIWGSALGESEGSSSPLCGGGDEGEIGVGGEDAAGRAPPGLPSSTFRPGREKARRLRGN